MSNESLLKQIASWHTEKKHDKICEAILALPEQEQTDRWEQQDYLPFYTR